VNDAATLLADKTAVMVAVVVMMLVMVVVVVVVVVVEIFVHGALKATVTNVPQSQLNK